MAACSFIACGNNQSSTSESNNDNIYATPPANIAYTITNVYPHDANAFTEGFEYHEGKFLESTGDTDYKGLSKLAYTDILSGKDIQKINLDKQYFGEGCTLMDGKIYQLTYKEQKCFVYDAKTLKKIKEFTYEGEGWGMTNDKKYIIMDNGSNNLYYRDPETFKVIKTIGVVDNNGGLAEINELEYIDGFIYANVWQKNHIVKIDPSTGKVIGILDFTGVLERYASPSEVAKTDVLNGIAYDSINKKFFITGKYWPKVFEFITK